MECSLLVQIHNSKNVAVFIVFVAILLDSILFSTLAPILPRMLMEYNETSSKTPEKRAAKLKTSIQNATNDSLGIECNKEDPKDKHETEDLLIGIFLAASPAIHILANNFVGPFCDRMGHDIPIAIGFTIEIAACVIYALGTSYAVMCVARMFQGVGSAFLTTSGLAKIAYLYPDEDERGRKISLVLSAIGMGELVGQAFGSILFEFLGKSSIFIILAGVGAVVLPIHLCNAQLVSKNEKKSAQGVELMKSSTIKQLKDPYILLICTTVFVGNMNVNFVETGLPLWMTSTMCSDVWMLGVAFVPIHIMYMAATALFSRVGAHRCRWLICAGSFLFAAVGNATLPLGKRFIYLILPGMAIGLSNGMLDSTIFGIAGHVTNIRKNKAYGSVYGVIDAATYVAHFTGPLLAGVIISKVGFPNLMFGVAIFYVLYAPVVFLLRNPKASSEEAQKKLIEGDGKLAVP